VVIAILASTPFCFIPAKDTYLSLLKISKGNKKKSSPRQNFVVSFVLVLVTYLLSVAIPNIKDAIAITGATVNPFIGFVFPILFYIHIDP
jgi:amino acid permease